MTTKLNNIETLKRNQVVTLQRDFKNGNGTFAKGDQFKFLGWYGFAGNLARLSRVGDNVKLMVVPADIGFAFEVQAATVETVKQAEPVIWDAPHSDWSGDSRRIVIATVLAGKDSGEVVMHMTPDEERSYQDGCAKMAELYPG